MKKTSLWPLQKALYERLSSDAALKAKITGVLDDVPEEQQKPYIVLGEDSVLDNSTKTEEGEEITHTLHVWSDYPGKKESKEIMNLILQAVTKEPLVVSGFTVVLTKLDYMNVTVDIDGTTRHGVMRFKFTIDNN